MKPLQKELENNRNMWVPEKLNVEFNIEKKGLCSPFYFSGAMGFEPQTLTLPA